MYYQDISTHLTYFKFTLCWPRLNMFVEAPQAQVSRASIYLHSVGQDLNMFVEAPQAQVSRVNVYLHSVGQDLTCLVKPHRHR